MEEARADPPPAFVEAVKDVLNHLYDVNRLNGHPLAEWLVEAELPRGASYGQALRQRIVQAIEQVNPRQTPSTLERQTRAFRILELRYVEAMPYREVMQTLALSQPQYHREQKRAIEILAASLWATVPGRSAAVVQPFPQPRMRSNDPRDATIPGDLAWVDIATELGDDVIELDSFLEEIVELLNPVALERRVHLGTVATHGSSAAAVIRTSRTALRQAVISSLEYVLDNARGGEARLSCRQRAAQTDIGVSWQADRPAAPHVVPGNTHALESASRLLRAIGGELRLNRDPSGGVELCLSLPTRRIVLLVVDDNQGMGPLVARFLADQNYTVLSARSVAEGLATAQRADPDVILLDLLMPHQDGWDALRLLRRDPATADLPIAICTVLPHEQALARLLGATALVEKPLTRPALLQVLDQCLAARFRPEVERPAAPGLPAESG